jgi:hypothetical protein
MKIFAASLLIVLIASTITPAQCGCIPSPTRDTTRWGGNELLTYVEPKIYKSLQGIARNINGRPLSGVLVEVFDQPEWIRQELSESPVEQQRIAACITRRNGRFCFSNIPSGNYELRLSKDGAWNVTHIYIVVDTRSRESSESNIRVVMHLGF